MTQPTHFRPPISWTPPAPGRIYTPEEVAAFASDRPDLLRWWDFDKAFPIARRSKIWNAKAKQRGDKGRPWRNFISNAPVNRDTLIE
jgi:hypothetical protein